MPLFVDGVHGQSPQAVTAPTAILLIDGTQVGAVQDLSGAVNFNVLEIDEVGNALTARFVPGVKKVGGRLRNSFVEPDIFFDALPAALLQQGVASLTSLLGIPSGTGGASLLNGVIDQFGGKVISNSLTSSLNSNNTSRVAQFRQSLASVALNYIQTEVVLFDIELRDGYDNQVHIFRDCVLKSRSIRLSQHDVILMTDIEFTARDFI